MTALVNNSKTRFFIEGSGAANGLMQTPNGESIYLDLLAEYKNYPGFCVQIEPHYAYRFAVGQGVPQRGWQHITIQQMAGVSRLFDGPHQNSSARLNKLATAGLNTTPVIQIVNIKNTPLQTVLDIHLPGRQMFCLLHVNLNGLSNGLLQSNNWDKHKPQFVMVKCLPGVKTHAASRVYHFLLRKNYEHVFDTGTQALFKLRAN
jgi:hypothetical protein